jgi:hypothetical protein
VNDDGKFAESEEIQWHEDILLERTKRVTEGSESFMDWEIAKKELRDKLVILKPKKHKTVATTEILFKRMGVECDL